MAQLAARGIRELPHDFVRATKRETADKLRRFGPLSICCTVATNGYLASVAIAALAVLTIAIAVSAGTTPLILPPIALMSLLLMAFFFQKYAEHGGMLRNIIRNKGAHWRRTRMLELMYEQSGYGFRGNVTAGATPIPLAAKEIVDKARTIEDAKIDVEYIASDPFIVVSRSRFLFFTERAYVFHWE